MVSYKMNYEFLLINLVDTIKFIGKAYHIAQTVWDEIRDNDNLFNHWVWTQNKNKGTSIYSKKSCLQVLIKNLQVSLDLSMLDASEGTYGLYVDMINNISGYIKLMGPEKFQPIPKDKPLVFKVLNEDGTLNEID